MITNTIDDDERFRTLKRAHQELNRNWRSQKKPCIICADREADEKDHLPPKVLYPVSLRTNGCELFTFPVCAPCNRKSSDQDFLLSFMMGIRLSQESILKNEEPSDPDVLALYQQACGHLENPKEGDRRTRLLRPYLGTDPNSDRLAVNIDQLPIDQTLVKIVKSIYWLRTEGDILQKYNSAWWIRRDIDTSKESFIKNCLLKSEVLIQWKDRFIVRLIAGLPGNDVGGFIMCSLHFYTQRAIGKGMSFLLVASPTATQVNGESLYEWCTRVFGKATIEPQDI